MKSCARELALLASVAAGICLAADPTWPQWRGPRRDDCSTETGLLKQWPAGGPRLRWSAAGCGVGYSSVAVTKDLIYTAGTSNQVTFVVAFDHAGTPRWRSAIGPGWEAGTQMPWAASYDGTRSTPTVDKGFVFQLSDCGLLAAFNAMDGSPVWSVDLLARFDAPCLDYGFTESVLVDGDRVICCPGGRKGLMAALDRKTGSTVWAATNSGDAASFSSPILVEDQGFRQIVALTENHIIAVDAGAGRLLWRHPFTNERKNNISTPIYRKPYLFASTGYGAGSVLLKLAPQGTDMTATVVWTNAALDNAHGGVVMVDGFLYGASHRKPAWVCLEFETGRERYRDPGVGMGSITYADGMLFCLGERGTVALVKCMPATYTELARFDLPKGGRGQFWAHPVVCGGRLYIRHDDRLFAYDIKEAK